MDVHDLIANFKPRPGISRRSEMAAYLRELITSQKISAGTKLPPTMDLARAWGSHAPAVQAAMNSLVKEGLVQRLMGRGTFVRADVGALRKVALYIPSGRRVTNNFVGHLMRNLDEQYARRGVRTEIWLSRRPEAAAEEPWKELILAANRREIQGVIVPMLEPREIEWLTQLPVPVAFLAMEHVSNRVDQPVLEPAVEKAMAYLADQGCRNIGLITVLSRQAQETGGQKSEAVEFHEHFSQAARRHGLEVRDNWIESPTVNTGVGLAEQQAAKFGYESFHKLWNQPEKPEALLVHTDVAAQGVLMALGQRQVRVPEDLRLVLHRNAEIGLFCPVPASFIEVKVQEVAAALVSLLDRISRGQAVTEPVHVAAAFVPEDIAATSAISAALAVAG